MIDKETGQSVGSPDAFIDPLRKGQLEPVNPVWPWGQPILPEDDEYDEDLTR